jgi:thymidylate synthase
VTRTYRNISFATAESFDAVLREGAVVTVREKETRELRNRITVIKRPRERCVFLPGRGNDVFAQIAETLWVIQGRDDLPWLTRYLPRAPDFSDDGGKTWRGAYGPRLRHWGARIDQLNEWRRLLEADPTSRRVVGVLFDPGRDFVRSNDIPCNNWLSWLIRDDRLHLNIAIRSNDAVWGFSGVNAFEWSVLHEMLAFWLGVAVGEMAFFASSFHVYSAHYEKAANVVRRFYGVTPYDFGISAPAFETEWVDFRSRIADWFDAEALVSRDPDSPLRDRPAMRDPLLASTLRLIRLKWGAVRWSQQQLKTELSQLPEDDLATAAYEFFGRKWPEALHDIVQPGIAGFFNACRTSVVHDQARLKAAIARLHSRKDASYRGAWKRRGELVSILPNIARKVDRLQAHAEMPAPMDGETILDTAVDLYVYLAKYRLYLAEQEGADTSLLPLDAPFPASDHVANFEHLVNSADFQAPECSESGLTEDISSQFEVLWHAAESREPSNDRQRLVTNLCRSAEQLVGLLAQSDAHSLGNFLVQELSR